MRNIRGLFCLAALALLFSSADAAESFPWQPTLETAKKVAAQTNRLVLIHFSAPWCDACRRMERDVFSQADVAADLQANFVPVKINADHFPSTAHQLGVTALPTTIIMDPSGVPISSIRGRRDATQYVAGLNQIADTARQQVARNTARSPVGIPNGNGVLPAPTTGQPPAAPPSQPTPNDRYADYYKRNPPVSANTAPRYGDQMAATTPGQGPIVGPNNMTQPRQQLQPPVQQPVQQQLGHRGVNMAGSTPQGFPSMEKQPPGPPVAAEQVKNPPLCLDGFCPVSLIENMENPDSEKKGWVLGDRRWGVIHRGRTYLFAGPGQQERFMADPDRYAPVMSGNDAVLAIEEGQTVPGRRDFGAIFGKRIYLFASNDSLLKFEKSPNRYASEVFQAMRAAAGQLR